MHKIKYIQLQRKQIILKYSYQNIKKTYLWYMCFFVYALNNKTVHLKNRQVKVKLYFLKTYQCEDWKIKLNCRVVFDKATCLSCWTTDRFWFFVGYKCWKSQFARIYCCKWNEIFHSSLCKVRIVFSQGTPEFPKASWVPAVSFLP